MKCCYDCKHYDRSTTDCLRLTHLEKDLVTGDMKRKGVRLNTELERYGKSVFRLLVRILERSHICGKEGRFFEPLKDKKE